MVERCADPMVAKSHHVVVHMDCSWKKEGVPSSVVGRQQVETSLLGEEHFPSVVEGQERLSADYQTKCSTMAAGLVEGVG